jgi:hypothetical protein
VAWLKIIHQSDNDWENLKLSRDGSTWHGTFKRGPHLYTLSSSYFTLLSWTIWKAFIGSCISLFIYSTLLEKISWSCSDTSVILFNIFFHNVHRCESVEVFVRRISDLCPLHFLSTDLWFLIDVEWDLAILLYFHRHLSISGRYKMLPDFQCFAFPHLWVCAGIGENGREPNKPKSV